MILIGFALSIMPPSTFASAPKKLRALVPPLRSHDELRPEDSRSWRKPSHDRNQSTSIFDSRGPYIAVITEPDACQNEERMSQTMDALRCALSTKHINLVSVRVVPLSDDKEFISLFQKRVVKLAMDIISLREELGVDFKVVINENVEAAIASKADGVHVKERDLVDIPSIRNRLSGYKSREQRGEISSVVIGTSCHSVQAGLGAWKKYHPDYIFVGTCYLTCSHPEKTSIEELEGPELPGKVRSKILKQIHYDSQNDRAGDKGERMVISPFRAPVIFAIGGIDESNCSKPVTEFGADGVAVIRSILRAKYPDAVVQLIKNKMNSDN